MKIARPALLATVTSLILAAGASAKTPLLHVHVDDPNEDNKVELSLPLSFASMALSMAGEAEIQAEINNAISEKMNLDEVRAAWTELKEMEGDFLTIDQKDARVKAGIRGDALEVNVVEGSGKTEVDILLPTRLVDVLLSGGKNELNLRGVIAELQSGAITDVITVRQDGAEPVRIWVE
ncbi:MAG: hypothetical protein AAF533_09945 [Acidobacteriota bacterium]